MPPDRPPTTALAVFRPRHLRQSLGCFVSALFGERLLLRQDGSAHAGISGASAPAERRRPGRSRQLSCAAATTRGQSSPMRAGCRRPELNRLSPGRRSGLHGSGTDRGTAPRRQPRVRPKRPASTFGRRRDRSSPARSPRRSRIGSSFRLKASPRTGVSNKRPCLTFGGDGESWGSLLLVLGMSTSLCGWCFRGCSRWSSRIWSTRVSGSRCARGLRRMTRSVRCVGPCRGVCTAISCGRWPTCRSTTATRRGRRPQGPREARFEGDLVVPSDDNLVRPAPSPALIPARDVTGSPG